MLNATFWTIFKHCAIAENYSFFNDLACLLTLRKVKTNIAYL